MKIAAITGTNGKSSTIHYAKQILEHFENEVWTITNSGILEPSGIHIQRYWCRKRGSIQKIIEELSPGKKAIVLIEAYSISLLADEWIDTHVDVAAFTSFGRDHLDVHTSMEKYFDAKFSLFRECLKPEGKMIVHKNVPNISQFRELSEKKNYELILYSSPSQYVSLPKGIIPQNYLCAKYISEVLTGLKLNPIPEFSLTPLSGRMEMVQNKLGLKIFIDFAHNPSGLAFVLEKLRNISEGKIITVLGCGGNRDAGKRKIMGQVADKFSDQIIVTDDNPRDEDPSSIRKSIKEGCSNALEIPSRKEAIKTALFYAQPGDSILIAGMGSDHWSISELTSDQSDISIVKSLLSELKTLKK